MAEFRGDGGWGWLGCWVVEKLADWVAWFGLVWVVGFLLLGCLGCFFCCLVPVRFGKQCLICPQGVWSFGGVSLWLFGASIQPSGGG